MGNLMWLWITLGSLSFVSFVVLLWYFRSLRLFNITHHEAKQILEDIDQIILKKYEVLKKIFDILNKNKNLDLKHLISDIDLESKVSYELICDKETCSDNLSKVVQNIQEQVLLDQTLSLDKKLKSLLDEWIILEESLQVIRISYNSKVSKYNKHLVGFPTSLVAKLNNLSRLEFFETSLCYVTT